MGDPRRFQVMADAVEERWPDRQLRIADVAAGKGYLRAALYERGYRNVVCFDKRPNRAHRKHYRYQFFGVHNRAEFDLVLGMHPDEATDVIMAWGIQHRVPFMVVPCCIRPKAWAFWGQHTYPEWVDHLHHRAEREGAQIDAGELRINGANRYLVGRN